MDHTKSETPVDTPVVFLERAATPKVKERMIKDAHDLVAWAAESARFIVVAMRLENGRLPAAHVAYDWDYRDNGKFVSHARMLLNQVARQQNANLQEETQDGSTAEKPRVGVVERTLLVPRGLSGRGPGGIIGSEQLPPSPADDESAGGDDGGDGGLDAGGSEQMPPGPGRVRSPWG